MTPDSPLGVPALKNLSLPPGPEVRARGNLPESVAAALREAILDGRMPAGTWLREIEVAETLEVSRTPVRDALRILAAEGLVTAIANRGSVVAGMTSDDVLQLYTLRESLESLAARLAARRSPEQCREAFARLLPKMREAKDAKDTKRLSDLNYDFHEIVRVAANNRYLDQALAQVHTASRRFPDPTLHLPGRMDESIKEHEDIGAAIARGDADEASRLSAEHIHHLASLRIQMLLQS